MQDPQQHDTGHDEPLTSPFLDPLDFLFNTSLCGIVSCEGDKIMFESLPYLYGLHVDKSGGQIRRATLDDVPIKHLEARHLLEALSHPTKVWFDLNEQKFYFTFAAGHSKVKREIRERLKERVKDMYLNLSERVDGLERQEALYGNHGMIDEDE